MLERQIEKLSGEGLSIVEIAEQLEVNEDTVSYVLKNCVEDFTTAELRQMAKVAKHIALNGDNERNRLQAATWAYEIGKGIRSPKSEKPVINILQFNQLIQRSNDIHREFLSQSQTGGHPTIVGIESSPREDQGQEIKEANIG